MKVMANFLFFFKYSFIKLFYLFYGIIRITDDDCLVIRLNWQIRYRVRTVKALIANTVKPP